MAVMHMERFHICGMKRDRKQIMEYLQRKGVVEMRDVYVENDEVFSRADTTQARTLLDRNADTAVRALGVLKKYAPEKKGMLAMLEGQTPISAAQHDEFIGRRDEVLQKAGSILKLDREIAEYKADAARYELQQEQLQPWLKLPMSQNFQGTKSTTVFIGSVEGEHSLEELHRLLAEAAPALDTIYIEIVSADPMQTCFYAIVLKKDAAAAEEALRAIGFARPPSATSRLPEVKVKRLAERKEEALAAIQAAEEKIAGYDGLQADLRLLEDHMKWRAEKYRAIEYLAQTKHTFVLDGYIPSAFAPKVIAEVTSRYECDAAATPVGPTENPPTLLKNNAFFSRPVESVLESYSLPAKGEIDPTVIMSIFYYIMFGLMFSDAGYGAIMVILCGALLLKFKNMARGMKLFFNMFFWCGVSTVFWGVMFGSYFGDLITAFSGTFMGREILIRPAWLDPIAQPMTLLMVCFLIGVIHLTVGYIMKGIQGVKNGTPMDILYETVFPVGIAYALILILMTTPIFDGLAGFTLELSPGVVTACWVVTLVCAVGILLTAGRESKNPGIRGMKGLYGLYNSLVGWISDILSYSRLLALGLATGVIASVMNKLGTMVGGGVGGVVGIIAFIVVFVVGHLINFLINALGAYVHSNRLEFVEFFGKFYEGSGHRFAPLRMDTKHYKIEEETQNV